MKTILLVEDDKAILNLLKLCCKEEGYNIKTASTGRLAIDLAVSNTFDLVILDLGLPDLDGFDVLSTLKSYYENLSIIIVSARSDESEKIKCLDAGACDYVQKPFSSNELMARIRVALRQNSKNNSTIFTNGNLKIDYAAHSVYMNEKEIHLTNFEYKILCLLSENIGKTLTHNYIISKVWGTGFADSNTLRVFMATLRRKIEINPYEQTLIRTDVGVGYRMNEI